MHKLQGYDTRHRHQHHQYIFNHVSFVLCLYRVPTSLPLLSNPKILNIHVPVKIETVESRSRIRISQPVRLHHSYGR